MTENPDQLEQIERFEPRDSAALKRDPTTALQLYEATGYTYTVLQQYRQTLEEIDEVIHLVDAQLADHG